MDLLEIWIATIEKEKRIHKQRQIVDQGNVNCAVCLYYFSIYMEKIGKIDLNFLHNCRLLPSISGLLQIVFKQIKLWRSWWNNGTLKY